MKRDEYWSIDKLLPHIHSSYTKTNENNTFPLSELQGENDTKTFSEKIVIDGSRVIRHYRLTEATFPNSAMILDKVDCPSKMTFVPCSLYSPCMASLNAEQRKYFY